MNKSQKSISENLNIIENILTSTGQYIFNAKKLIITGIIFMFIPLIQLSINNTFWLMTFANENINIGIVINIVFYILLFKVVFMLTKTKNNNTSNVNIYVKKAIATHEIIMKTMLATIIILSVCGYGSLSFSFVYIFIGLIYNLFSRFSINIIRNISVSYIIIGLLSIFFVKNYSNILWQLMIVYLGISYIVMGIILNKNR